MSKKNKTVAIGRMLLAKNEETLYIKLEANPKADDDTKEKVAAAIEALGTDVLYFNKFDDDFKEKYNIPDFVRGRIVIEANPSSESSSKAKGKSKSKSSDEVDF